MGVALILGRDPGRTVPIALVFLFLLGGLRIRAARRGFTDCGCYGPLIRGRLADGINAVLPILLLIVVLELPSPAPNGPGTLPFLAALVGMMSGAYSSRRPILEVVYPEEE